MYATVTTFQTRRYHHGEIYVLKDSLHDKLTKQISTAADSVSKNHDNYKIGHKQSAEITTQGVVRWQDTFL